MPYIPEHTVELWLHAIDSMVVDNYHLSKADRPIKARDAFEKFSKNIITIIPEASSLGLGEIVVKLINKQRIVDSISGEDNLIRIFSELKADFKHIVPYLDHSYEYRVAIANGILLRRGSSI